MREIMTGDPVALSLDRPLVEAAERMRDAGIGDVVVYDDDEVYGVVTDRDIVVRGVAGGRDMIRTPLRDVCSRNLATISPDAPIDQAVTLMRERAVRRLPVLDGDKLVGIVSLGDLAVERDERSTLGGISAAPPNN
ncbi:MAG TPA: CBS domain-containing protein [Mycobacteriales bacterium]|nr:CBS domain-containing protein [Mycobacteriales bacterium]